jgi:hypothetical protein
MELEGFAPLQYTLLKLKAENKFLQETLRNKERQEDNHRKNKDYNRFWIHKSNIVASLALALTVNSL